MRQHVEAIGKLAVAAGGKIAVAIVETGEAFVEPRKLGGKIVDLLALETVGIGRQVERPARQMRDRLGRIARPAVRVGKQRRRVVLHDIADDLVAVLIGIHGVKDITGIAFEPAHRRNVGVALHHADISALVGLPGIGRFARHRPLHAAGQRQHRKQHIVPRHHEIVDHAGVGRIKQIVAGELAGPGRSRHRPASTRNGRRRSRQRTQSRRSPDRSSDGR